MSENNSKIVEFFRKVGDTFLGLKKIPEKMKEFKNNSRENLVGKPDRTIPSQLQGFFENRNAEWPEYVFFKVQMTIILFFATITAFILTEGPWIIFGSILFLTSFYAIETTIIQLKPAFKREYKAYRNFVLMCLGIGWFSTLLLKFFPLMFSNSILNYLVPVTIVLVCAIGTFIIFRIKYGRNYTYGTVREVKKDKARVRIGYDLRSNVKNGTYLLDSFIPLEKGDVVKIEVNRSTLGLRGSEVESILEKISEE